MLRAAAAERNQQPILDILKCYIQKGMKVLEISSGTGQHCMFFAEHFADATFQPSEVDSRSIHSIVAYIDHHRSAGLLLKSRGYLITYGPYAIHGSIYPQSNVDFDRNLRDQNPEWGLRDIDYLERLGQENGMQMEARHEMPANNHMLVFRRE